MADKIFSKPIFMGVGRAAAGGECQLNKDTRNSNNKLLQMPTADIAHLSSSPGRPKAVLCYG